MMCFFVVLTFILFIDVQCAIEDRLKADFFHIYKHVAIETREIQDKPVTPDNVTYYLYTKNHPDEYIKLNDENLDLLTNKKIVFFIHGWTASRESQWCEDLKNAFLLTHKDYSVVQVDWKEPANQLYYVSSINTYDVAKIITSLILDLKENYSVSFDNILLVGHSLGGQITGFIGKNVYKLSGEKLPRIIALDPAGPLFTQRPDDKRLNKNDAQIVQVIHTDGDAFGFREPCGTIDFFPNGGNVQPGCKTIDFLDIKSVTEPITCDHGRACEYFVEAILNPKEFIAKSCSDWDAYKDNKCENEDTITLGDITSKATGNFYLETNKEKPYARKLKDGTGLTSKVLTLLQH